MKYFSLKSQIKWILPLTIFIVVCVPIRLIGNDRIFGNAFSNQYLNSIRKPTILSPMKQTGLQVHRDEMSSRYVNENRMNHDEQQLLLKHAVEMRRILRIKADLTQQAGYVSPLTLTLSKASGYGEEIDLFEQAITDGEAARENLVTGNVGLVYFCVNDILKTRRGGSYLQSLSKEDLVQEGAIGLARAIDRWNPQIGGKFSTYAVYWVRACVLRCIAERDDFVKVPEHVSAAVRKLSRAAYSLGIIADDLNDTFMSSQWKEAKAAKALAVEAGLSERQFIEAMKIRERRRTGIVSLETWMTEKKKFETNSVIGSDDFDLFEINATHIKSTLSKFLRPKEIEALSWRYGLNHELQAAKTILESPVKQPVNIDGNNKKWQISGKNGEALSFSEVGNKMHISAEYGRRLCHAAIDKLKQAVEEGLLEPALLSL